MGRKQVDSEPTRYVSLILLLTGLVSCALVYIFLSAVLRPNNDFSVSGLESLALFGDGNAGDVAGGRCCKGVENLELWGAAVKWGSEFKFNSSEECCKACKGMCSGNDGPCLCDTWVFCGDREACGPKFGECWLKKQKDTLAPDRQDAGPKVSWTSGLIFGQGQGGKCSRGNWVSMALCGAWCVKDCSFQEYQLQLKSDHLNHTPSKDTHLFYCKLGCSTAMCTNMSTPQNPNAEKVGSCMGSCSDSCAHKYSTP